MAFPWSQIVLGQWVYCYVVLCTGTSEGSADSDSGLKRLRKWGHGLNFSPHRIQVKQKAKESNQAYTEKLPRSDMHDYRISLLIWSRHWFAET